MLREKDFGIYGLESLLADSKYKIDTADPEKDRIDNSTVETLRALQQFVTAKQFEDKWALHGMSDNLKDSFYQKFEQVGIPVSTMASPANLKNETLKRATDRLKKFYNVINCKEYLDSLDKKLSSVEKEVIDIFPDEVTTYMHCDAVAFAKMKIRGYNHENFSKKLKGLQSLLGAFSTKERTDYEKTSIRDSMEWHLIHAGFSFNDRMVIAPKDENVIENNSLENLGWTPEKVNGLNSVLESVLSIERRLTLDNVLPKIDAIFEPKVVATLVENSYNVRNIMAYTKNTLYTMCNQYLSMVRSYQ